MVGRFVNNEYMFASLLNHLHLSLQIVILVGIECLFRYKNVREKLKHKSNMWTVTVKLELVNSENGMWNQSCLYLKNSWARYVNHSALYTERWLNDCIYMYLKIYTFINKSVFLFFFFFKESHCVKVWIPQCRIHSIFF